MQNFIKQITNKANKMKSSNVWNKQESVYYLSQADRVNMSCYVIILNVFPYCIMLVEKTEFSLESHSYWLLYEYK